MNIQMADINYRHAGIDIRQRFSFTKAELARVLPQLCAQEHISGCLILSTCNRTQLWMVAQDDCAADVPAVLCRAKHVDAAQYRQYFEQYTGGEAVQYLFELAGGLKSQILGEDQILTQLRDAVSLARDAGTMNQVLEVLFRMAVTAGKEVKTKLPLPSANSSAPLAAITKLAKEGCTFAGKKCLVIGNGMMGRLTAQLLMERGADVTVTVRQYRSGIVEIPRGAKRIDYGRRYELIPVCDYIFSATASPNVTIRRKELEACALCGEKRFIDLAVPRDIECAVGELSGVRLYDIDYFHIGARSVQMQELVRRVQELLAQRVGEYLAWYEMKDAIPVLKRVSHSAAEDVQARIHRPFCREAADDAKELEDVVKTAVEKVVGKLMFGIRDSVDAATFRACVTALDTLYKEERS